MTEFAYACEGAGFCMMRSLWKNQEFEEGDHMLFEHAVSFTRLKQFETLCTERERERER